MARLHCLLPSFSVIPLFLQLYLESVFNLKESDLLKGELFL